MRNNSLLQAELLPPPGARILAAVSGGADSVCLLAMLHEYGQHELICAHYEHGIRGEESQRDAAFVRELCQKWNIPFRMESGNVPAWAAEHSLGLEEAARQCRYEFLQRTAEEFGCSCIATAHNMNDNAETVLLNLARGTGLRGLCGIPPRRDNIIRPLLNLSRSEIEAWLRERNISYCEDSTNASDLYARNRARHHVLPAFESLHPQAVRSICRAAVSLREDEEYLNSLAEAFLQQHGRDKLPAAELAALPRPTARRVLRLWLGTELSFERSEALLQLCSSSSGSIIEYPGGAVEHSFGCLIPHRAEIPLTARIITENCEIPLPEIRATLRCRRLSDSKEIQISFNTFCFSCGSIHGILSVTSRREGDAMRFLHGNGTTSIKKKMSEKKIPSSLRSRIPVIRDDTGPLAVAGLGQGCRACAVPGEDFYKIDFIPWEENSI